MSASRGVWRRAITLLRMSDPEVLADACWALSYLSEPPERVQPVIDAGVVPRLVELLGHTNLLVQTPALRTVGNICAQEAEQTQAVLDCGALPRLGALLHSPKKEMRKEACWAVSNITAGPTAQVEAACAAGLVPRLVELASEEEYEVKKEAAYALCNCACSSSSAALVGGLVDLGVLPPLLYLLDSPDAHLLLTSLDAIEAMLRAGAAAAGADAPPAANPIAALVREADGVDYIEALQEHENGEVYQKAAAIVDAFFGGDDEPEDALVAPAARADGSGFAFGVAAVADGDAAPFSLHAG